MRILCAILVLAVLCLGLAGAKKAKAPYTVLAQPTECEDTVTLNSQLEVSYRYVIGSRLSPLDVRR